MARMRAAAGAGYGAAVGLNKFLDEFFRNQDEMKRAATNRAAAANQQQQQDVTQETFRGVPQLFTGERKIDSYSPGGQDLISKVYDISKMGPTPQEQLAKIVGGVGANTTDSQIMSALQEKGLDTTPTLGQRPSFLPSTPQGDGTDQPPVLPSTQYGPVSSKPIQQAQTARQEAIGSELQASGRKATEQGGISQATKGGELAAIHANAPTATADAVADLTAKGPVEATNAAQTKTAVEQANLAPDLVRGRVSEAGQTAGAQANAALPAHMSEIGARSASELSNGKALDDYRQANDVTAATKTMMEGAKMILPRIQDLKQQAEVINKMGMFGPVMSRLRELSAKAGSIEEFEAEVAKDPSFSKDAVLGNFETTLGSTVASLGRINGGARGGGSIAMIKYMKDLLNASGTYPLFQGRIVSEENNMLNTAAGPKGERPALIPTPTQTPNSDLSPNLMRRLNGGQ